jgi:hypothetical protein
MFGYKLGSVSFWSFLEGIRLDAGLVRRVMILGGTSAAAKTN